jgi:AhpD family alkylhydroperoxidase
MRKRDSGIIGAPDTRRGGSPRTLPSSEHPGGSAMSLLPPIEDHEASAEVAAIFADIRATRRTDTINDFWRVLAHDPATLRRTWENTRDVMREGALDPLVKELIYLAVSVTNNCEYCIHTHHAAGTAKGMSPAMFNELLAVTALANANNRLANGYRIDVDERYRKT